MPVVAGQWQDWTVVYEFPENDVFVGTPLHVVMQTLEGGKHSFYDNIVLTYRPIPVFDADISGASGVPDHQVDTFDLLKLADNWLECTRPQGCN
jgi:hypothetical protein